MKHQQKHSPDPEIMCLTQNTGRAKTSLANESELKKNKKCWQSRTCGLKQPLGNLNEVIKHSNQWFYYSKVYSNQKYHG